VSDKYVNKYTGNCTGGLHMMIRGRRYYLQYLFITDWKFCCGKDFIDDVIADPGKANQVFGRSRGRS
jgi:hypothetical protein